MVLFLLFLFTSRFILKELIILIVLLLSLHFDLPSSFNLLLLPDPQLLLLLYNLLNLNLRELFFLLVFHLIYIINIMVESAAFNKIDEVKVSKNVDRIINIAPGQYLAATYHLNKETQHKSGSIVKLQITSENK